MGPGPRAVLPISRGPASVVLLFAALAAASCSDTTAPINGVSLAGTYIGELQGLGSPIPDATLVVTHSGTTIGGTLSAGGRTATLEATINDAGLLEGTFTFGGDCPGTASTLADFSDLNRIVGSFEGNDCQGSLNGTYQLLRQSS